MEIFKCFLTFLLSSPWYSIIVFQFCLLKYWRSISSVRSYKSFYMMEISICSCLMMIFYNYLSACFFWILCLSYLVGHLGNSSDHYIKYIILHYASGSYFFFNFQATAFSLASWRSWFLNMVSCQWKDHPEKVYLELCLGYSDFHLWEKIGGSDVPSKVKLDLAVVVAWNPHSHHVSWSRRLYQHDLSAQGFLASF